MSSVRRAAVIGGLALCGFAAVVLTVADEALAQPDCSRPMLDIGRGGHECPSEMPQVERPATASGHLVATTHSVTDTVDSVAVLPAQATDPHAEFGSSEIEPGARTRTATDTDATNIAGELLAPAAGVTDLTDPAGITDGVDEVVETAAVTLSTAAPDADRAAAPAAGPVEGLAGQVAGTTTDTVRGTVPVVSTTLAAVEPTSVVAPSLPTAWTHSLLEVVIPARSPDIVDVASAADATPTQADSRGFGSEAASDDILGPAYPAVAARGGTVPSPAATKDAGDTDDAPAARAADFPAAPFWSVGSGTGAGTVSGQGGASSPIGTVAPGANDGDWFGFEAPSSVRDFHVRDRADDPSASPD